MKNNFAKVSAIILASMFITACQTNPSVQQTSQYQQPKVYNTNYNLGVVQSVNIIQIAEKGEPNVGGAVVGGVAGGVLGNQVGKGNGRKAATIIGALVGAGVGSNVQANMNTVTVPYYELFVTLHNGQRMRIVETTVNQRFYNGQYVKVFQHPRTGQWRAVAD